MERPQAQATRPAKSTPPSRRCLALALLVLLGAGTPIASATAEDPLAGAIARWQERIRTSATGRRRGEGDPRRRGAAARPGGAGARRRASAGWRSSRLERVWTDLEAAEYRSGIAGDLRGQMGELEREWQRLGPELGASAAPGPRPAFEPLPAAARALAEAALAQMPVYYDASLDYGRNTAPEYGLFYLGAARAQRDFVALVAGLPRRPAGLPPLAPRSVSGEIAALRDELLTAYAPPLSIDSHPVFIRISALLKEADELTAAGSHYGALLRLLDARARLARLTHPGRSLSAEEAARRGSVFAARPRRESARHQPAAPLPRDRSLSAADPDPEARGGEIAAAIFDDVLPYFPVAARSGPSAHRPSASPRSPSLWSVGPTPETSPIQQVCWQKAWWSRSRGGSASSSRTTATRSSRSDSG